MRKLHTLHIPSWYPSHPEDGHGGFFRDQAVALNSAGCKVGVIHCDQASLRKLPKIVSRPMGVQIENDSGVITYRWNSIRWFPSMPRANSVNWLRRGRQLFKRYIEEEGLPDVLHAQSLLYGGILAARISREYRIPYIITEHSTGWGRGLFARDQVKAASRAVQGASGLVAVSIPLCEILNNYFAGPQFGIWKMIPNIVNQRFLEAQLKPSADRSESFIFLFVGFLQRKKAVDNLVAAFGQAFSDSPGVYLRIGGHGPERTRLEAQVRQGRAPNRIKFLGALGRNRVLAEMQACDAFVLPSRHETFGVVVIESLAVGTPVVATRSGGPETIVGEEDGFLVEPDDIEGLANALTRMYHEAGRFSATSLRARCKSRYGSEEVAAQVKAAYDRAISGYDSRSGGS